MHAIKRVCSAILLSGAALVAQAGDASHPSAPLVLVDGSAHFGATFAAGNMGNNFSDHFSFDTTGVNGIDALVSSISRTAVTGLDITGFALYGSSGLIASGNQLGTGAIDLWSLSVNNLGPGSYYVQVTGHLVSSTAASYGANINLTPVPEPTTYVLLLCGLGLLGALAIRHFPCPRRALGTAL